MLYPKNQSKILDKELFKNPTCEYRGAPFWAWNCKLTKEELLEQIDNFKTMGMGGFHMHVRTGMASPYLDEEFMGYIRLCVEEAKKKDMLAWLYDENRWPSGSAGGIVSKNPEFVMRNLLFTTKPYSPDFKSMGISAVPGRGGTREENGYLVACYDVSLNEDGTLKSYKRIGENDKSEGTKWYAYNEAAIPSPWFNDSPYVDTLNKKAIEKFIETTHEKYYEQFGEDFGKTIPAIFTDEPQFAVKGTLAFATEVKDVFLPWTNEFPEKFEAFCGFDILDSLPEVFWELEDNKPSYTRYKFHDFVTEQFVSSFCDTIGKWCDDHNIMLSGHLMHEDTLTRQTEYIGEAMRGYRAFTKMPGMDLLVNRREFNTAKQCTSVMHQQGSEAVMSELYGVTGWDFDFRGHKLQGDWQAALGVTVRVPHLTWMSMKGEAKRDYPASIGYQSPWWKKYNLIETHFARLNTVLTRGKPLVNVAVVYPIESYWLNWGPSNQTVAIRDQLEKNHRMLGDTLLLGMIDFDFICESLLPDFCEEGSAPLNVGQMKYDTIIVPGCQTLRSTTMDRLEKFKAEGGNLIFLGDCPKYVDAKESDRPRKLYEQSKVVSFTQADILDALEDKRFIDTRIIRTMGGVAFDVPAGTRTSDMMHQLRQDSDCKWLFVAKGFDPTTPDVDPTRIIRTTLNGTYIVEEYDTLTGEIRPIPAKYENGKTSFERMWWMHDSMLLRLTDGKNEGKLPIEYPLDNGRIISKRVPVKLDEPNALLLDMAEYAFDGGELHPLEEFLRLDNECRRAIGIPLRQKAITQPYKITPKVPEHTIYLRMTFDSEIYYEGAKLALEEPENATIVFNGNDITAHADGWYVDKAIETVPLTAIVEGENVLEVTVPLGERTNLEWFYLLGDFGVRVDGCLKTVTKKVTELAFGNIVTQGLPFYTGNIIYEFDVNVGEDGKFAIRTEQYRGGLVEMHVDGEFVDNIVFSPYTLEKTGLTPGTHKVGLKLYGTRQNGFAQVHHTPGVYFYQSPDSWREGGALWMYEYQLKPAGILKSPQIFE
ncbi:MAG: hypothetical protein IKU45_05185 [Clostridia bacterium]|nr:hypothetical protein [Clostridia bacterium]